MQSIVGKDQGIKDATTAIDNMASSISLAIVEMGKLIGKFTDPALSALGEAKNRARTGNKSNPLFDFLYGKAPTTYDPMSQINPGLTPGFVKLAQDRIRQDKESAKRQKELAALTVKQTKAMKEQTALAKAKAVLDKASAVMNMDLIQNTAALMGKVTQDETLRLKLQQAILLGNSEAAGNLAQELLASQTAAIRLSAMNPLGGFTDAIQAALSGVLRLRNELAALGSAKVPVPVITPTTPTSVMPTDIQKTPDNPLGIPSFYGYSGFGQSFLPSKYPTEIVVSIDPSAAALGITSTVITNSANGNSNDYSSQQSFSGGRGL
jgi:hypothetical protein